eukprot:10293842-Alexandrium_andersonii.AAC.1
MVHGRMVPPPDHPLEPRGEPPRHGDLRRQVARDRQRDLRRQDRPRKDLHLLQELARGVGRRLHGQGAAVAVHNRPGGRSLL